jgi:hypothetical protein
VIVGAALEMIRLKPDTTPVKAGYGNEEDV